MSPTPSTTVQPVVLLMRLWPCEVSGPAQSGALAAPLFARIVFSRMTAPADTSMPPPWRAWLFVIVTFFSVNAAGDESLSMPPPPRKATAPLALLPLIVLLLIVQIAPPL